MKLHRFFIHNFNFSRKEQILNDKEAVHQIIKVLRLKKGEDFIVFNGSLKEAKAEIIEISQNFIKIRLKDIYSNQNELEKEIVLYMALVKKDNFELAVKKATEIGVKKIIPLITDRTVKLNFNFSRMEKVIKESAEQSGRGFLPEVKNPIYLKDIFYSIECDLNLFFDPIGKILDLRNLEAANMKKIGVWIGPEGGWKEEELNTFKNKKFEIVSFGNLIFRAETAAIIGCYIASKI